MPAAFLIARYRLLIAVAPMHSPRQHARGRSRESKTLRELAPHRRDASARLPSGPKELLAYFPPFGLVRTSAFRGSRLRVRVDEPPSRVAKPRRSCLKPRLPEL